MKSIQVGTYRLIARLGRSATADVFLALQRNSSELFVIKSLRESTVTQAQRDAARVSLRLRHPNIVRTYEVSQVGNSPLVATEYLDGQPLDRVLDAAGRSNQAFSLEFTLQVVCDVLAALEYAHDLSDEDAARTPLTIVHRAITPHNIFVTYRGDVKLLDCGLFGLLDASDKLAAGDGKAGYLAAEQAEGGLVDRRADLFAVGVVLWECLARRRYLPVDSAAALLEQLRDRPPPPLAAVRPDLDPGLTAICERALQRDPDKRHPSAAAMRAELAPYLATARGTRAELASAMQAWFESVRQTRTRRIEALLGEDASVTAVVTEESVPATDANNLALSLAPTALPHSEPPPNSVPPPSPRPRARNVVRLVAITAVVTLLAVAAAVAWKRRPMQVTDPVAKAAVAAAQQPKVVAPADEVVLRMCGSNTIGAELAPALVETFLSIKGGNELERRRETESEQTTIIAALNGKRVGVEITARGSATAFTGLAEGSCDIGMASRAINDNEAAALLERGDGDLRSPGSEHVIALDGIAVIVHPNNPLRSLDRAALHDIFTGRIDDWSALGAPAGPISVHARDSRSGTFDTFKHLVIGEHELVHDAKRYAQSDVLADAVASDPSAIGFVGLAYTRAARALAVGEPGATPMLPSQFTVATEGYMLSRRLYLYTLPKPRTPWIAELVSFALSRRAQEMAAKNQFVDLGVTQRGEECDEHCTPAYALAVAKAQRLSIDFRFRFGSDEPDSRASRDIERLVGFLGEHRASKLLLLGFSDVIGNPSANAKLSVERAKAIDHELGLRGVRAAVVSGFGADMPVASNASDTGRQRNRRVEAWVEY